MLRTSGRYLQQVHGGETVNAYIPFPLPPDPAIDFTEIQLLLESANQSLGRLDGLAAALPDHRLFLYANVRKEAVLSSQIEGTQSSLSDLLLFETANDTGAGLLDDVIEVSNYVAAMEYGLKRIREDGFPISSRLIREIHGVLLREGRGSEKEPGEFRRSQNWIGGSRPGNAIFVPPPPSEVASCMSDLEKFIHEEGPTLPLLIRAGLLHVQFETIHPFLDGNGRMGRLLITLLLCAANTLRDPLLYLSIYLKRNREQYYVLLMEVRQRGDWEAWLKFFLRGVQETADEAVNAARRILRLFERDRERVSGLGRKAGSALRAYDFLRQRAFVTVGHASQQLGLSYPTAATAMGRLVELGIAREVTGGRRNQVYGYTDYVAILSEGTEPLPRRGDSIE
jgi:Fic family protein